MDSACQRLYKQYKKGNGEMQQKNSGGEVRKVDKILKEWRPNRGELNIITKRWTSETLEETLERVVNGLKNVHPDIKINAEGR